MSDVPEWTISEYIRSPRDVACAVGQVVLLHLFPTRWLVHRWTR